jgi:type VI secretion system protein ImpA
MADLDTLLAAIRDDSPTGVDLRNAAGDVTFDKIKSLRTSVSSETDPEATKDNPKGKGRDADWKGVAHECSEALTSKSKDLELATSLTDAWARTEGFAGLRDGIRLVVALCDRFWDRLHPGYDGQTIDLDSRAMPLNRLGGAVQTASACTIFTAPDPRDAGRPRAFSWADHQNAVLVDERAIANKASADGLLKLGFVTGEEWLVRIKAVDAAVLHGVVGSIEECQAALGELRAVVEKRFDAETSPNLIAIADILGEIREHVSKHIPAPAVEPVAATAVEAGDAPASAPQRTGGPPVSRDDALRRLEEVAEYFRRNEPHSPVAHLVERAARWGRMPLEDVLREVIPDQGALAKIMDTLGVRPS